MQRSHLESSAGESVDRCSMFIQEKDKERIKKSTSSDHTLKSDDRLFRVSTATTERNGFAKSSLDKGLGIGIFRGGTVNVALNLKTKRRSKN